MLIKNGYVKVNLSALLQAGKHLRKDQNILQKLEEKDEKIEILEEKVAELTHQYSKPAENQSTIQRSMNNSCSICFEKVIMTFSLSIAFCACTLISQFSTMLQIAKKSVSKFVVIEHAKIAQMILSEIRNLVIFVEKPSMSTKFYHSTENK